MRNFIARGRMRETCIQTACGRHHGAGHDLRRRAGRGWSVCNAGQPSRILRAILYAGDLSVHRERGRRVERNRRSERLGDGRALRLHRLYRRGLSCSGDRFGFDRGNAAHARICDNADAAVCRAVVFLAADRPSGLGHAGVCNGRTGLRPPEWKTPRAPSPAMFP